MRSGASSMIFCGVAEKLRLRREKAVLECTVIEQAAKGGYCSICFEPNNTPWETDAECAEDAFQHFQLEIRCNRTGWTTDSSDTGGWYRYTANGRTVVNWLT